MRFETYSFSTRSGYFCCFAKTISEQLQISKQSPRLFASLFTMFTAVMFWTKFEPFFKAIPTRESETKRTKFCGNNFLGKGFRKTLADSFFLNSDVASGGGVWGGILRLLLFLFWRNSGGRIMDYLSI